MGEIIVGLNYLQFRFFKQYYDIFLRQSLYIKFNKILLLVLCGNWKWDRAEQEEKDMGRKREIIED